MTREREEAHRILSNGLVNAPSEHEWCMAFRMAIKALEQEPCEDTISRQAVLSRQYRIDDSATLSTRDVVNVDAIEELPSVTPQRPRGKWIDNNCSICGYGVEVWNNTPYCPNCGAKMEAESEGRE